MSADPFVHGVDLAREADFQLGRLHVRPSRREIECDGRTEKLEPRVMQALVVLAANRGRVVSRDQLVETCWDRRIVGDDAINRCMGKVRRVGNAHGVFTLEAVPRVGYQLNVVAGKHQAARAPWMRRVLGLAMGAALVALTVAVWSTSRGRATTLTADSPVAVRSFQSTTADPAARAFAAAMPDEVAGRLTESRIETVASTVPRPHLEIDGTVGADAGRLRTRVRLRDAQADVTLWSEEFSAPAAEASHLRFETSWRLVAAAQTARAMLRDRSPDLDPVALGLAVQMMDSIEQESWKPLSTADALVRRAPRFAPGWAAHGMVLLVESSFASEPRAEALRREAIAEGRHALQLRKDIDAGYILLALATPVRAWTEREHLLRAADSYGEARPDPATAEFLTNTGRIQDGRMLSEQILEREPAQPTNAGRVVFARYFAGRTADALAGVEALRPMRPADATLRLAGLTVAALAGEPAQALAILKDPARRPISFSADALQATADFVNWRKSMSPSARNLARGAIVAASGPRGLPPALAAQMLSMMGEIDSAFEVANRQVRAARFQRLYGLLQTGAYFGPATAPMREDRRFIALARDLGLLDYWRSSGHWPDFCEAERRSICAVLRADTPQRLKGSVSGATPK